MTTPTDAATLVAYYNTYTATADEIAAWKTVTVFGTADKAVTSVGLFGADLTDFTDDCVALEDKCDVADFEDWSGWAIGVNWAPGSTAPTGDSFNALSFKALKQYIQVKWVQHATNTYEIKSGVLGKDPAAAVPATADVTSLATAANPFTAWSAKPVQSADGKKA